MVVSGSLMQASACSTRACQGVVSSLPVPLPTRLPGFRHQYDFFHVSTAVEIGGIHHGADLDQRV